jgi:hypothetical protein
VNKVVLRRDSATFTLVSGRLTFAAPVAGGLLASQFRREGRFELRPPSDLDKRQIGRLTGEPKATDTFQDAVFLFTDDSFAGLSGQAKTEAVLEAEKEDRIARTSYRRSQPTFHLGRIGFTDSQAFMNSSKRSFTVSSMLDKPAIPAVPTLQVAA